MDSHLADFLAQHAPIFETTAVWGGGALPLRERSYLSRECPPLEYVTSVRSIVLKGGDVLVLHNRNGSHIFPGGRCKPGEALEETLRREILEEAGWTVAGIVPLGFVHFHHLKPKPPEYKYPHPDFIQLIYLSRAVRHVPGARQQGDFETSAAFRPVDEILPDLSPGEQRYLKAALKE